MPQAARDLQSDSSRTGEGLKSRGEWGKEIDASPPTIAEEKKLDPSTPGTGNDHAGTTKNYRE